MKSTIQLAQERVHIITAIITDVITTLIAWLFYFTVFIPFSLIAKAIDDPLQTQSAESINWLQRTPIPSDLDKARRQG